MQHAAAEAIAERRLHALDVQRVQTHEALHTLLLH